MRLSKEYIVALSVLVIILLILGAGYVFYYIPRIESYKQHLADRDSLVKALTNLETVFDKTKPDALISATRNSVQPYADEVLRRSTFFRWGETSEIEAIPEGKILRFYYEEKYKEMMAKLDQEIFSRSPRFVYPKKFNVPEPASLAGKTLTEKAMLAYFADIEFGGEAVKMLADAGALEVRDLEISPTYKQGLLLDRRTVGCTISITLENLVKFLDKLRLADRYFSVDALSIQNQYLAYPLEPPMEVSLLISQAAFIKPLTPEDATSGAGAAGAGGGNAAVQLQNMGFFKDIGAKNATTEEPVSWWQRFKKAIGL